MTEARNKNPLHGHAKAEDTAHPWTQDTLSAHLEVLHGVDDPPMSGAKLSTLIQVHDRLRHSQPSKTDEDIYRAALHPERRLAGAVLQPCRDHPVKDYPGHRALVLSTQGGPGGFSVCLEPPDVAVVRAALEHDTEELAQIVARATAALGPAAAKYVQQAHSRGYSLGVRDMEWVHDTTTEAQRVNDFLLGFYESAVGGDEQSAVSLVREMIGRKLDEQEAGGA